MLKQVRAFVKTKGINGFTAKNWVYLVLSIKSLCWYIKNGLFALQQQLFPKWRPWLFISWEWEGSSNKIVHERLPTSKNPTLEVFRHISE